MANSTVRSGRLTIQFHYDGFNELRKSIQPEIDAFGERIAHQANLRPEGKKERKKGAKGAGNDKKAGDDKGSKSKDSGSESDKKDDKTEKAKKPKKAKKETEIVEYFKYEGEPNRTRARGIVAAAGPEGERLQASHDTLSQAFARRGRGK